MNTENFKMYLLRYTLPVLLFHVSSIDAWVHRPFLLITSLLYQNIQTLISAGILHNLGDLQRMSSYVTKGRNGQPSIQYSNYLQLAADHFSFDTYGMSTPVATLTSRAAFEADATAAYQNALVRFSYISCAVANELLRQMWYLSGNQSHANTAINIMDSWSSTVKNVDSNCERAVHVPLS
jgi:hypothetical protein